MKRIVMIVMAIATFVGVWAQQFSVTGEVTGLQDGTVLQLVPMSHDQESPIAETIVKEGRFLFNGSVIDGLPFPMCAYICVKDSRGGIYLMLEDSPAVVNGNVIKNNADQDGHYNYDWNVTVSGSPLTSKLNDYQAQRDALNKRFSEYHERHAEVLKQHNAARQAKDKAAMQAIEQTDAYKAYAADEKEFFATVERTYKGIINENRDTYWGPMMAMYLMTYFTEREKPMFESFSTEAQQSWYGKKMKEEMMPAGDTGEKAKELTVRDDNGTQYTLSELAKGKKVLLIDFWASWCGPCRKEIPNVKKQYELYKDKGFEVVSISIDKNEAAWRKAVEQEQLQWPNFLDSMGAADAYKVRSIPAMFLIDAQTLTVIESGEYARGEFLAQKLAELFGNE